MDTQTPPDTPIAASEDTTALAAIRTETALSRFPIHRLVKKGTVQINIRDQVAAVLWEVTYNSKYGQPGPLAYKIDTLVVNRRIEEAGHPVPEVIRLGSLRDISRELGTQEGGATMQAIRRALLQNASAFINAHLHYRAADRSEHFLEASFTRYSVLFTGETLPDGRRADAVYLALNRPYIEVLNGAVARPLDYDYIRALTPAAQRFYEIVSYQIYAALRFRNMHARLRYSEYCLLSTATRYTDFDHVKKQMYKIHKVHLDSGYLKKVSFDATEDEAGQPDWWMCYVPGPRAAREFQEFSGLPRKSSPAMRSSVAFEDATQTLSLPFFASPPDPYPLPDAVPAPNVRPDSGAPEGTGASSSEALAQMQAASKLAPMAPPAPDPHALGQEWLELVAALTAAELNRGDAERLAREKPVECRRQLEYLPYVGEFKNSRGAYLRRAIEEGYCPPKGYAEARKEAQARVQAETRAQAAESRRRHEEGHQAAYEAFLAQLLARLEEVAPESAVEFTDWEAKDWQFWSSGPLSSRTSARRRIEAYDQPGERLRRFRSFLEEQKKNRRPVTEALTFWEWDTAHNPTPFSGAEPPLSAG